MNYEDIRKGNTIKVDNELYVVTWAQHHKPGKGGAVMRTKLKNIKKGTSLDRVFRGGDTIEEVSVNTRNVQFLYADADIYTFMDTETFEQYEVPEDIIGDGKLYLKEGMECTASIYDEQVINIDLPIFVELEITETDPGVKGDTVTGGSKPATLETGAVVQIPLFVNLGEIIKVDTRENRYVERVSKI